MSILARNSQFAADFDAQMEATKRYLAKADLILAYLRARPPSLLTHSEAAIEAWDRAHPEFAGLRQEIWGAESMSTKHTPAPWGIFEHRDHSGICVGPPYTESYFRDGEVRDVCRIGNNSVNDEMRANARLIAAAPELLAALKLAISTGHLPQTATGAGKAARAAIAKATGEP
jgi:hypothetical protein